MKTVLAFCALLLASFASAAATYTFTGGNYAPPTNFTPPCGTGSCGNFTTAMRVSGSFSTNGRLAPNNPGTDISAQLAGGNFTDGLTTYGGTDPNLRVYQFLVVTDANSNVTDQFIILERWQTPGGAHVAGDRFDYMIISPGGTTQVFHNRPCGAVGAAPSGVADSCNVDAGPDGSDSAAASAAAAAFAFGVNTGVPTLSEIALILLALAMAGIGFAAVHRRGATPA